MIGLALVLVVNAPVFSSIPPWPDITFEIEDRSAFYSIKDGISAFSTQVVFTDRDPFGSNSSGFSLVMGYDPSMIAVRHVWPGDALLDLNDHQGPDYFSTRIDPAGFVTVGVVASFMQMGGLDYRDPSPLVQLSCAGLRDVEI